MEKYIIELNGKIIASYKLEKCARTNFEVNKVFCSPVKDVLRLFSPDGELLEEY